MIQLLDVMDLDPTYLFRNYAITSLSIGEQPYEVYPYGIHNAYAPTTLTIETEVFLVNIFNI